jgi:hypothetical protein
MQTHRKDIGNPPRDQVPHQQGHGENKSRARSLCVVTQDEDDEDEYSAEVAKGKDLSCMSHICGIIKEISGEVEVMHCTDKHS